MKKVLIIALSLLAINFEARADNKPAAPVNCLNCTYNNNTFSCYCYDEDRDRAQSQVTVLSPNTTVYNCQGYLSTDSNCGGNGGAEGPPQQLQNNPNWDV